MSGKRASGDEAAQLSPGPGFGAAASSVLDSHHICLGGSRVECGNLLISVRMRAPFAPHMSCGSRATRQNLKRDIRIPSDELSRFVRGR